MKKSWGEKSRGIVPISKELANFETKVVVFLFSQNFISVFCEKTQKWFENQEGFQKLLTFRKKICKAYYHFQMNEKMWTFWNRNLVFINWKNSSTAVFSLDPPSQCSTGYLRRIILSRFQSQGFQIPNLVWWGEEFPLNSDRRGDELN